MMITKSKIFCYGDWLIALNTLAANLDVCTHWSHLICIVVVGTGILVLFLLWRRLRTRQRLEKCGLPTVFWKPKFVNYIPADDLQDTLTDKKLSPSTITNILPRMERLKGPFGMYGTVYGISTAVIHVAHPIPAVAILSSSGSRRNSRRSSYEKIGKVSTPTTTLKSRRQLLNGSSKAPAYNHFKNFCGEGVFTTDGSKWKEKRSAVLHALLRGKNGQCFEKKIEDEAHRTVMRLVRDMEQQLTEEVSTEVEVNVVPLLQRATIGLIYRYITHSDLESDLLNEIRVRNKRRNQNVENSSGIRSSLSSQLVSQSDCLLSSYLQSIIRIRMIILAQSRSIWFLFPRWCYRWFSSMFRAEEQTMGPIRDFAVLACAKAQPGSPIDLLRCQPIYQNRSTKKKPLSKDLIDETITILFAGQDTSAATLSWALHLLSLYPEVQTKLAQEIQLFFDENKIDGTFVVTKKLMSRLPYLDAVIKETMRLYPVAPFVVRKLSHPIPIEDESNETSTILPSHSLACIWIYGLHRNPEFWNRPNDFLPERWLVNSHDPKRDKGIACGAYIPFATGPRNCVGQPLAHIILRSLLLRLINCYEFRDTRLKGENQDPLSLRKDMQVGFTVLPKGGVRLAFQKRKTFSA